MHFGFVITNYNNTQYTKKFIDSIFSAVNSNIIYHIVIVDNNSNYSNLVELKQFENNTNISIIYNEENLGYFNGLNIGIKFLRNNFNDIIHILVGNNDIKIDKLFFNQISKNVQLFDEFPVISPNIINSDGHHQNPHVLNKISNFREFIYDLYYSNYLLSKVLYFLAKYSRIITSRNDERHYNIPSEIYQGHGSCFILGPIFFKNFSSLFSPTFLMGEEFFLAFQLKEKKFKLFYCPYIIIYHAEHSALKNVSTRRKWEISKSSHKVYRKYLKLYNEL